MDISTDVGAGGSADAKSGVTEFLAPVDHPEEVSGVLSASFTQIAEQLVSTLAQVLPFEDASGDAVRQSVTASSVSAAVLPVPVLPDLSMMSPMEVLAAAGAIEQVAHVVEAAQVMLASRVNDLCVPALGDDALTTRTGCRNTIEVLQRVTRTPARALSRRLRVGKRVAPRVSVTGMPLPPFAPVIGAAFTAGGVSLTCAELMANTLERAERVASPAVLSSAEHMMVDAATGGAGELPVHDDDMRTVCHAVEARLDQDGPEPTETCDEAKRGLRFGAVRDGLVPVHGFLLPEVASLLGRVIDAICAPKVQRKVRFGPATTTSIDTTSDAAVVGASMTGAAAVGSPVPDISVAGSTSSSSDNATVPGATAETSTGASAAGAAASPHASELAELPRLDPRTSDQQRHDALMTALELCAKHSEMPHLGGAPVTVLLQVKQSDVEGGRGTGWVTGHDGTPARVPMSSVRHAACAGSLQRVTQTASGKVVELGTVQRVFNAHQRRAITLRDGGCIIPGCTVPGTWCEIHHVTEYANGGPTHTDNGVLLCWYHHRSLDTSGWVTRMNDGVPEVQAPYWVDQTRRWYRTGSLLRAPDGLHAA